MKRIIIIAIIGLAVFFTFACRNSTDGSIDREELFSLGIGPMEDQIALYKLDGSRGIRRIGFSMRDGLFYISDGNSGKIVRYNSYGNLLFMIYNEETNPPPLTLRTNIPDEQQATRWAFQYPLEEPGWITVDSNRHIFVEDRLPYHQQYTDPETRSLLDGIVLHFDQDGRFINYFGREGIGGSPFPRIVGLSSSIRDELVVICRIPDGWELYWFNTSGQLLFLVKISTNMIPAHPEWAQAHGVIDSIKASVDSRNVYIKVDYSRDTFDQSTNTRTGSVPVSSFLWTLNIEDGSYTDYIEIPLYEIIENGRPSGFTVFYSMMGIARNGRTLLYVPVENGYVLLYVNLYTRSQRRGNILISSDELMYNDFYLSPEGILCGMLADDFSINMVWWRTDRFMSDTP
ncbi:MAG: hypothetical protein LBC80_01795 [Treponema sp.]|jgi:hypothetical protein|nr:hypothetical protein [Treponema sp.]